MEVSYVEIDYGPMFELMREPDTFLRLRLAEHGIGGWMKLLKGFPEARPVVIVFGKAD